MIEALIGGERDPLRLAGLARGRLRAKLDDLELACDGRFTTGHAQLCRIHLDAYGLLTGQIATLDELVERAAEPFAAVIARLVTIPGIGPRIAQVIVAETGGDMARFATSARLAAWAGLAPGDNESAGKRKRAAGFNTKQRSEPPDDVAEVLAWVARNSAPLPTLAEAAIARRMLDQATGRLDGKNAAASTARRHRIILANAMDYAVELGLLETNPIRVLKWTAPRVSKHVDRRSVVNPRQARALLEAVRAQQPSGPRLVTFFAVMYYAGLCPEEAINLSRDNVILPPHDRGDDWGELHIRGATPDAGSEWTDDGSPRERRQLKHRAEGDSRIVPTHPELTRLLREHLGKFGTAPDGCLFGGVRGGELPTITYRRAGSRHARRP
jgi:integrase